MKRIWKLALIPGAAMAWLGLAATALAADDNDAKLVTFSKDVAPILQSNCQGCHRPGDIAPMSLLSYQEARPWVKSIKKAVSTRTMPPWHADPKHGKWDNDSSLTEDQINTIVAWIDQGAPEGNAADMPPAMQFDHNGWKAGVPDVVLKPSQSYTVGKEVNDEYRCFVIPTGLKQDVWAKGFEQRPGNRAVVHHIMAFLDIQGKFVEKDNATPEPGFLCGMGGGAALGIDNLIGGWAPGNQPNIMDGGVARLIPAGSYVVYQLHYHNTTGADQADQSSMGIYLSREPVVKRPRVMPVSQWNLSIPAGEAQAKHHAEWKVPFDITVGSIMPHMHFLGKGMQVTLQRPDGKEEILLNVPRYDFNWQITYSPAERIKVPAGSTLKMDSMHDNSAANPANPTTPPKDVKWGEATDEEMAIAWVGYVKDDEDLKVTPAIPEGMSGTIIKKEKLAANAK